MTRQQFKAIAHILAESRPGVGHELTYHWENLIAEFADWCEKQNERFDRERFIKACGGTEETYDDVV